MSYTESATSKVVKVTEGPLKEVNVHYNDAGQGDTVVFLHGSGAGATSWANFSKNVDAFAKSGFRVLLIDSPGWGKSDPIILKEGNRSEIYAAAVKGVLDAINIEKAALVGNSMGGASAILFALQNPTRISKLVTMGGGAGGPSLFVPMPTEGIKLLFELYRDPTFENLKRMLNVFVFDPSALTDDLIKARYDNMMNHQEHLTNFVKSMEAHPRHMFVDLSARMHEIKCKTLVTWGRDDRFVPLDSGLKLLWTVPDVRMHVFSRCGHWAQWEHAEEFNRLVTDFLGH